MTPRPRATQLALECPLLAQRNIPPFAQSRVPAGLQDKHSLCIRRPTAAQPSLATRGASRRARVHARSALPGHCMHHTQCLIRFHSARRRASLPMCKEMLPCPLNLCAPASGKGRPLARQQRPPDARGAHFWRFACVHASALTYKPRQRLGRRTCVVLCAPVARVLLWCGELPRQGLGHMGGGGQGPAQSEGPGSETRLSARLSAKQTWQASTRQDTLGAKQKATREPRPFNRIQHLVLCDANSIVCCAAPHVASAAFAPVAAAAARPLAGRDGAAASSQHVYGVELLVSRSSVPWRRIKPCCLAIGLSRRSAGWPEARVWVVKCTTWIETA